MDYQALLFDPIYTIQGVSVTLTLPDSGGVFEDLTALDKTAGVDVGDSVQVQTIKPVAALRVVELSDAGIDLDQLPDATISMNDFLWRVASYRVKPSAKGENDGEVYLILTDKTSLDSESDWILASGFWDDSGHWHDESTWED